MLTDISRETSAITHEHTHTHANSVPRAGQLQLLHDTHAAVHLTGACTCTCCTSRATYGGIKNGRFLRTLLCYNEWKSIKDTFTACLKLLAEVEEGVQGWVRLPANTVKRWRSIKFQLLHQNDFLVLVYHILNNSKVTLRVKYNTRLYVSYGWVWALIYTVDVIRLVKGIEDDERF